MNKIIRKKDDLDRTFARLMESSSFKKEWNYHIAEYELARQIIQTRIDSNVSQRELAKRAHSTQAVISRIESQSVSPSLRMVSKIAAALGKKLQLKFV